MNVKRYAVSTIVGFIFIFIFDFIFHGVLLLPLYETTVNLWRSPEEMQAYFPVAILAQFLISAAVVFIFTRNYEGKGIVEGVRFGLMLGALFGVGQFSMVAYMPISFSLAGLWLVGTLLQFVGLGVILSLTYKK